MHSILCWMYAKKSGVHESPMQVEVYSGSSLQLLYRREEVTGGISSIYAIIAGVMILAADDGWISACK